MNQGNHKPSAIVKMFWCYSQTNSLGHHVDLDPKHATLFLGWRSLQAEVPTCELHGELHFDLMTKRHS